MNRQSLIVVLVLGIILLLVGYFAWQALTKDTVDPLASSDAAAALIPTSSSTTYTNLQGEPQSLSHHLGSVIVVHSWATWVPTSPQSLRDLSQLQAEFAARNVTVLAINRSEPRSTALQFLRQVDATNLTLLADEDDQFYQAVGGQTMPETLFYDDAGQIVHHAKRPLQYEELVTYTAQALRTEVE